MNILGSAQTWEVFMHTYFRALPCLKFWQFTFKYLNLWCKSIWFSSLWFIVGRVFLVSISLTLLNNRCSSMSIRLHLPSRLQISCWKDFVDFKVLSSCFSWLMCVLLLRFTTTANISDFLFINYNPNARKVGKLSRM